MRVLVLLQIQVGNLTVLERLKEARRDSKSCFLELPSRWFMLKSPHSIRFVEILCNFLEQILIDLKNN